jgi:ribosome maturation factor RimP
LKEKIIERVREILKPILDEVELKLVDVEFITEGKPVLRIYIYNPEGTSLDDCEYISRRVGAILDIEDLIPYSYTLEVSSPGLDRKLKNKEEYEIFKGRDIKIVVKEPIENKHVLRGRLEGLKEDNVIIKEYRQVGKSEKLQDEDTSIPLDNITSAKLDF